MPKKSFTTEQIISKLWEAEVLQSKSLSIVDTCYEDGLREDWKFKKLISSVIKILRKHYNNIRPHSSICYSPQAPETIVGQPSRILQFRLT